MIYDDLAFWRRYVPHRNASEFCQAIEFLRTFTPDIAEGKHVLKEGLIYANVQEYESKIESSYEAHREYVDIQCVVSGEEYIYVADIADVNEPQGEFDVKKDIQFFRSADNSRKVLTDKDNYVILFPKDAHQPCMAIDGKPGHIRKIVVKVPYVKL